MSANSRRAPRPLQHQAVLLVLVGLLLLNNPAQAQRRMQGPGLPSPRLLVVTPAGGKAGGTVEVILSGLDLEDPQGLLFSQPGIKAEPLPALAPAANVKKPAAKSAAPALRFKVSISTDTPLGIHDVRLVNKWGVSNPRAFVVGDLDEVLEKEPNNDVEFAQRVALNTTINGAVSDRTDVDYFVFAGKKGQRVLLSCLASSIDSRLQAALELYDRTGRELAFNRHYQHTDALLDYSLPEDGDYFVRLFGFTYTQGSPEHFYRLTIATAPWIDAVFPPMVEPGKSARVTVYGRNLPGGKPDPAAVVEGRVLEKITVTVNPPDDPQAFQRLAFSGHVPSPATGLDGFELRVHNDTGMSNPFLLTYARAPVVLDNGDNDDPDNAQEVTLPCEIAGRIEKKRDRDWYTFTAHKGEVFSIEAYADRLGAPIDLYFVLRNALTKKTLAELDDNLDNLNPVQFFTRTEDPPRYRFAVPEDGRYQLLVTSREASIDASPRDFYRVRITSEQPDFRLVVMPQAGNSPDACVLRQGARQYYTVFVWRQDGFNDEIVLGAEGLPAGVSCPPQIVGPGQRQATLVLSADADTEVWTGTIAVKGTATIGGQTVVREARPVTITWPSVQQNIATVSRLDRSLVLAVRDRAPYTLDAGLHQIQVQPGQRITLPVKVTRLWPDFKGPLLVTVLNLPLNMPFNNNQPVIIPAGKNEANLVLDFRPNVPPGNYTLLLRGQAQVPLPKGAKSRPQPNGVVVQASAPIALTILPKQLARLILLPANVTAKAGGAMTVLVRINRMYDYPGPFQVRLVLPDPGIGLRAEDVTIPAGKDEIRLAIKVDEDAAPGNRANVAVRATALFQGKFPLVQEAKLNVKVVR